ncbi:MFS transporter [Polaromonas sp. SM01]|uniref:MFS transporter n=1 Tax=Polaromonas sp. SM01 TaxID=3085630 RepID=UPI0029826C94|nr:MFS transporter [Polaromonas sp. SM01]MDW5444022.1 MFS transporter [Polaromonas sp. SM01]
MHPPSTNDLSTPGAALAAPAVSAGHSWAAVASVAVGTFALVTSEFLPVGLLPAVAADLHVTEGTAGLMITLPGLVAAIAAPAVTVAAGRLDRRLLLWAMTVLLIGSNLLATFSHDFMPLLIGRLLLGVAIGGFWATATSLAVRLVPAHQVGRAASIIFAGVSLGTVVGVPVGALIGDLLGWRAAFAVAGALSVAVLAAQLVLLPSLSPMRVIGMRDLPALLRNPDARIGLLLVVFFAGGHFMAYTFMAPFLQQVAGVSVAQMTLLLLAYGVAGFVGNLAGGAVAGRSVRLAAGSTALLMAGAILLLPLMGRGLGGVAALLMLWGFAFGAMPVSLQMWMFKSAPAALEGGSALFVAAFQIAIAAGAGLGGLAVDALGVSSAMWGGGAWVALALVTVCLMGRNPGEKPTQAVAGTAQCPAA